MGALIKGASILVKAATKAVTTLIKVASKASKATKGGKAGSSAAKAAANTSSKAGNGASKSAKSGSNRTCNANSFDDDTTVLLADGSRIPISEVEVGDLVWAADPETGQEGARRVVDLIRHGGLHTMVAVELVDGTVIDATDWHPFWVTEPTGADREGGWADAIELREGDLLLTAAGSLIEVSEISISVEDLIAYNLTVAGLHTYHVSDADVLVHNCPVSNPPGPRKWVEKKPNAGASYSNHASREAAENAANQMASLGGRCRTRGVCASGDHVHVDFINARGRIFHTHHFRFPRGSF